MRRFVFAVGTGVILLVFSFSPVLSQTPPYPPSPPPEDQKCNEYIQIYAEPDTYYAESYQKLDLICPKDYRAISCEAEIKSEGAYYQYFVTPYGYPQTYVLDETSGSYAPTTENVEYWGCQFHANNNYYYYNAKQIYPEDWTWRIRGYATCVPVDCVQYKAVPDYQYEWKYPDATSVE